MNNRNVFGGFTALYEALAYVVGIIVMMTILVPAGYIDEGGDPASNAVFLVEHRALLAVWNIIIYILFGIALVILVTSVHHRLKVDSPFGSSIAAAFGYIWATVVIAAGMVANVGADLIADLQGSSPELLPAAWAGRQIVIDGLGGGNEVIGGLWTLLVSLVAIQTRKLPLWLNILGLIVGIAGVATLFPMLSGLGMVFGLAQIPWFIGLGTVFLRQERTT